MSNENFFCYVLLISLAFFGSFCEFCSVEKVSSNRALAQTSNIVATVRSLPGAVAQAKIISIVDNTVSSIKADAVISNESVYGYEYFYEWCVVSQEDNECGGGDDIFSASASKFILAGEDFNTYLDAVVPNTGDYWFKLIVYWDDQESGSHITFTAEEEQASDYCGDGICNGAETCSSCPADCGNCGGGGPGGGGGIIPPKKPEKKEKFQIADLDKDGKVNLIDFSILLYWWGKPAPAINPRIDINQDGEVNLSDFSIMLYYWTG